MKHYFRYIQRIAFSGILLTGLVINANAQDAAPDGWEDEFVEAPFDGGVGILIAAAVAFKARKEYISRKGATKAKS